LAAAMPWPRPGPVLASRGRCAQLRMQGGLRPWLPTSTSGRQCWVERARVPWWRREKGATGWSEQQGMAPQRGQAVVGRSSAAWQWRPRPWRPRQQSRGGHEAARGAKLGHASAMAGALWCIAATTPFRRTRGARDGARLGVRFRHIRLGFGPGRLKQSCCAQATLQLLLRVHRH